MYKVELSAEAQRFYDRCNKPVAKKLARCFQALEKNPRDGNNIKPLKGKFAGSFAIAWATCMWCTRSMIGPSQSS
jgi:mRNA interferase RelE/StbE